MLDSFRHIHFIGMKGSGVSALVHLAKAHGIKVSGSDASDGPHKKENLPELAELVIYSEAINRNSNPEYQEARRRKIPTMSYFEVLGKLSEHRKTIVVTGTHGKTTTTAMLGQALAEAGMDPTVILGSRVPSFDNHNIRIGHSQWLVAEGCEYRRSFLSFKPFGVVLLNCELEHVDYYKDEDDYASAFWELVSKIPKDGFLIYNADDKNCRKISEICRGKIIPVTIKEAGKIKLQVPGGFNRFNALHAKRAALQIGAKETAVNRALKNFAGTARRMEVKGEKGDILVMDDYGHHPTEVRATLGALKEAYPKKRIICVFQPHQYSRTHRLIGDFKKAFKDADKVIVPNIFEARDSDEDKAKISAEKLADTIPNGHFGDGFENTLTLLKKEAKKGDLILTMGAGNVYKIGEDFLA